MWTHKVKFRIVPKDEEYGIMTLAFQSQEFGFGYPLTFTYLQTINEYCDIQTNYGNT